MDFIDIKITKNEKYKTSELLKSGTENCDIVYGIK